MEGLDPPEAFRERDAVDVGIRRGVVVIAVTGFAHRER
jgi:hypothetical protein